MAKDFLTTVVDDDLKIALEDFGANSYVSIAFSQRTSESFDPKTGVETESATTITVKGLQEQVTARDIYLNGGLLKPGDVTVYFRKLDFGASNPSGYGVFSLTGGMGGQYRVVSVEQDPTARLWKVYGRRLGEGSP